MPTHALISTPLTEPWTAWILLLILVLGALTEVLQPGVLITSFTTLLAKPERSYADTMTSPLGQIVLHLARLLTVAMTFYLMLFERGAFRLATFAWIILLVAAIYLVRWLLTRLLDFTFQLSRKCATAPTHYANLFNATCVCLYPALLCLMQYGPTSFLRGYVLIVAAVSLALVLYKCIRAFLNSPLSFVYILIYVATLEVLPLVGTYVGVTYIVRSSIPVIL